MKTGNTRSPARRQAPGRASMEPGHEDREYPKYYGIWREKVMPQWSPVMKTGNTAQPGVRQLVCVPPQWSPVMKTGNTGCAGRARTGRRGLNGARS